MKKINKGGLAALMLAALLGASGVYAAVSSVNLGSSANFAILAGSTITNTGSSVINGDLGLSPGTAITGFPPATLNGSQHVADALSIQAETDLTAAYSNAVGRTPATVIGAELGGSTLTPGVYSSPTLGLTGTLTLNAQGDPSAVFILQSASTLVTAGASSVVLAGNAQACNIFWQVGSSATLGANSSFKGTVLALTSITLTTGASVEGRVLARNGAVTLDSNTITKPSCASAPAPVVATTTAPVITPVQATSTVVVTIAPIPVVTPVTVIPSLPTTGASPLSESRMLWVSLALLVLGSACTLSGMRKGKKA